MEDKSMTDPPHGNTAYVEVSQMDSTFTRALIVIDLARWPALLETSHIQDEFHRITMVHLESKFMSKLDEYTPGLLKLFHSKGGTMGLKLKALLLQTPSNPNINITRDVVIRCLMVHLGERTDQLLKEMQMKTARHRTVQGMAMYSIKTNASEGSHDIGIVVEGIR
ncbi:Nuclear intron maturase 4 mitochondrial, partial [Dissostichus eleginoides]